MFRIKNTMCAACVAAFAAVSASAFVPSVNAAETHASSLPAGTMAIVNGVPVSQAQLDKAVRVVGVRTGQPDSPQMRQALKNELIVREIFRQNAEKAHYNIRPQVQQASGDSKVDTEIQLYLHDNVHPEAVTEAQVKARYDAIVASLGKEEFKTRLIVVPDEATAKIVLGKARAGDSFEALARQYSVAPSKADGGALSWVSFKEPLAEGNTHGLPLSLAQAMTQLGAGGISQPVHIGNAWAIVKLDEKRATQIPAFDAAKDRLYQQMQAQAEQKAMVEFAQAQLKGAVIQQ